MDSAKLILAILFSLIFTPTAPGQTTQPARQDTTVEIAQLQLRANESMAKNDFSAALPILKKIESDLSDQPDLVGPILEEIRVCQRQISGQAQPAPPAPVAKEDPIRKIHPAPTDGQILDLDIKDLGNFPYDPAKGGNIPDDVQRLDGCKFRTRGFMTPLDQAEHFTSFALQPSVFICICGGPPEVRHTIIVQCPKDKPVAYTGDPIVVEGILHVKEEKDDGFIVSIFQLDCTSVKPQ